MASLTVLRWWWRLVTTARRRWMASGSWFPARERRRIVACTWVGDQISHFRAPPGKTIARCFLSGEDVPDPATVHRELQELTGIRGEPRFHRIFAWPRAMAQYRVGHAQRVSEIRRLVAATPGLHLAGNAYSGIGIPDCVRTGKQAAEFSASTYLV